MNNNIIKNLTFLKSALADEGSFISTTEVINWLVKRNKAVNVKISKIKFKDLIGWSFSEGNYNLKHNSGNFFSIDGIKVETNYGNLSEWKQPIINQPEIGYLGFITKEFDGILHFLVQAKIEPGNLNNVQLSPTLQATRSNYSQVHKGKAPRYLEYFRDRNRCTILLDQLQSEQGARFLHKRNRNIILKTEEYIKIHDDFIWLTLGQIKKLIQYDNLVNMDTRTVISGIPFGSFTSRTIDFFRAIDKNRVSPIGEAMLESALKNDKALMSIDEIIAWFTDLKCKFDLKLTKISLSDIDDWIIDDFEIRHKNNKFFKVIATDVEICNREVAKWMQPLIQPAQEGLIAFIVKKINGVFHFLIQAKLECGNFDVLEMAPTVQCLTGNYRQTADGELPFLKTVLNAKKDNIIFDTLQSEEGGRFYHEQNRNLLIKVSDDFNELIPINYCWMTLNQLHSFLKYNNYLNIQARSLISAISFI
ncbi:MAG: NDP-hexose 2,3-dehydratase [Bacteroidetes bacterium HGW-Bacteroidetes-5]|jgi:oxidase EvaA|nr:MAG: NDP-hexose 2,3-dehydratase [Bacteroidetes bacterium HGW-Bacteroidetes-5]